VFQLANQEAQRFGHEYVGTEHLLLGLIKEGSGVAASVLRNCSLDVKTIRIAVEKLVQSSPMTTMGKLPQTPRTKKVIEYAMEEARSLHHNHVGTEHILLGLIREAEGTAVQVLRNLGVTLGSLREATMQLIGTPTCEPMRFHIQELARTTGHSFFQVFANGVNCGNLTMTPEELGRLADLLESGSQNPMLNATVEITHGQERA